MGEICSTQEKKIMGIKSSFKCLKVSDHSKRLGVYGRGIKNDIQETWWESVEWIDLALKGH